MVLAQIPEVAVTEELTTVWDTIAGLSLRDGLSALGILVVAVLAGRVVGSTVRKIMLSRAPTSDISSVMLGRFVRWVIYLSGFVFALQSVGIPVTPFVGILGLFGLALALAFQHILENFVAGAILLAKRPFDIGDGIGTNGHVGRVTGFTLRDVTLVRQDGVTVTIPNANVLGEPLENYSATGGWRSSLEVGVAYDTDLTRAAELLVAAVHSAPGVHEDPVPEAWVTRFGESSIDFSLEFFHDPTPDDQEEVRHFVAIAVHEALGEAGIEIPFPQRVVHGASN